jgi:predicted ATPase
VELVQTLPDSPARARQELSLQITLGEALMTTQGFTIPEVGRAFARARDLCEQAGEASQVFRASIGRFSFHASRAEHERVAELVRDLLRLAQGTGDPAHLPWAHMATGEAAYWRGELLQAREHLEEAIARYDPQEIRSRGLPFYQVDPGCWALFALSWALWQLGYPEQASTRIQESLALVRELSHPFTEASTLLYANQLHGLRGESRAALEGAEALIAFSSEHGFLQYVGMGTLQRAAALADQGQLQEGIAGMRAILEAMRAEGMVVGSPASMAILAAAYGEAGQAQEGLALMAEAQEFVAKTGERVAEAEIHRTKGELLLARSSSDPAQAEACFREALAVARRQSAKSYELRAATGLARLWQQQGRREEARELLSPVYAWFTEGFDTRDLRDAKALLEELA